MSERNFEPCMNMSIWTIWKKSGAEQQKIIKGLGGKTSISGKTERTSHLDLRGEDAGGIS